MADPDNESSSSTHGTSDAPNGDSDKSWSQMSQQLSRTTASELTQTEAEEDKPDNRPAVQTAESRTSEASITGSLVEGGLNATRDFVDRSGRAAAAATLTNGPAGNLPAAGFANRTGLADAITHPTNTAAKALDMSPYGPNAASTQQLSGAARTAATLGKVAGTAGKVAGPFMGAYEGFRAAPEDATTGEQIANTIGGGLKEVDDMAVGAAAGIGAAAGTTAAAAALVSGGVTAPAAPAVAMSVPVVGAAAGIAASVAYDGTGPDNLFDNVVDSYVEPAISTTVDTVIDVYRSTASWFNKD